MFNSNKGFDWQNYENYMNNNNMNYELDDPPGVSSVAISVQIIPKIVFQFADMENKDILLFKIF